MKRKLFPILLLAVFLFAIAGCSSNSTTASLPEPNQKTAEASQPVTKQTSTAPSSTPSPLTGQLKVHFLDVGQADSILVQMPNGQNMLVDAGNNDDGTMVVSYLKKSGVKQIDYLVGTHPHEDHIGGLDTVIKGFEIGKVYMPKVTTTTKTFEDVLKAVQAKGLKITTAKAGVEILNTAGLNATMLAPNKTEYDDMNNYSAVIKVTYGQVSFLLTGDAEEQSEFEMLASSVTTLKADVLKVGHHGSNSSTSVGFLKAVNPKYAVISVGTGNDYGHPHKETLQKLNGMKVYRTDLNGTIVFTTDGKDINVTTEKSAPEVTPTNLGTGKNTPQPSGKVYVDSSGRGLIKGNVNSKGEKIYHLPGGAYYNKTVPEMWFKSEEEAQAEGFRASMR